MGFKAIYINKYFSLEVQSIVKDAKSEFLKDNLEHHNNDSKKIWK